MLSPFAPRHMARKNKYNSPASSKQVVTQKERMGAVHSTLSCCSSLCFHTPRWNRQWPLAVQIQKSESRFLWGNSFLGPEKFWILAMLIQSCCKHCSLSIIIAGCGARFSACKHRKQVTCTCSSQVYRQNILTVPNVVGISISSYSSTDVFSQMD